MQKALVVLASSAALVACGTTVPSAGSLGTASDAGVLQPSHDGVRPSLGHGAPALGAVSTGAPGTRGAAIGRPRSPAPQPSGPGAAGGPRTGGRAGDVPGVTPTTVKLGVEYISTAELGAFASAAGVKAVGRTDMLKAYQAAAAAVNAAGGVAGGRKLVIVPRQRSTSESNAQAAQASCSAFTDDNRVLLANLFHSQGNPGVPCLTSKGVVAVGGSNVAAGSQLDFQRFGGRYLSPGTAETITAARAYVQALVRQGFLTRSSKIGLLWFDFPDFRDGKDRGLVPALKSAGLSLTSEFRSTYSGSGSDLGSIAAQMQSAALQFRSADVDRVLTLDYQGTLQYFFMSTAESQGYRPRYGLATWSDAEFLRANSSAEQLAGSTGIGWMPGYDLAVQQLPLDEPKRRCLAAMRAAEMPPLEAQTDTLIQLRACEEVFFVQELLNTATDLSPSGLAAAAASLGNQPSYSGFLQWFGPSKLWGAAAYRDLAFGSACSCFAYRGPNRPF